MRQIAIDMGYMLNEYGLYELSPLGTKMKKFKINSEKDIFKLLGMEYLSPNKRS
jgi:DNA polymerase/3'-5' exonuclease PolX